MDSGADPDRSTAGAHRRTALLAVVVVLLVGAACSHAPVARGPFVRASIAWPSDVSVIEVVPVGDHGEMVVAEPAQPFRLTHINDWPRIGVALDNMELTYPLPKAIADAFDGRWTGGSEVIGYLESCLLGGTLESSSGHRLDVEGGVCFNIETKTWRIVRLSTLPMQLRSTLTSPRLWIESGCLAVTMGDERAMFCTYKQDGGLSAICGMPIPGAHIEAVYRFVGLR